MKHSAKAGSGGSHEIPIAEKDRIPAHQKAAYGMGVVSDHYATYGLNSLALPVFNVILGLSPTLVSTALALARLWDAITDPVVGSLSDNCRSRYGRRRPYLFAGAILTGCFFPVIWLAPGSWDQTATFVYLCFALLIFYSCYSLMSVPYESLGMELTADYRERTNLYSVRTYIERVFNLGIPWLFALANLAFFGSVIVGVRVVAVGVGIMIIASGLLPAIFCRERYGSVAKAQPKEGAIKTLVSLAHNGPLLIVIGSIALFLLAMSSVAVLDFYLHTYYIYGGDIKMGAVLSGYNGTIPVVFSILGAFLVQKLSKRFEKHQLLLVSVAVLFLCKLGLFVTYVPGEPMLTLVTKPFVAMAQTAFWILIISMRADVGDWDEFRFGRRREGMIAAVNNWLVKVAFTVAIVAGGLILEHVCGFDRDLGGDQAPVTLNRMLIAYATIPSVALVLVFGILWRYPLTQMKMARIRTILERRRDPV